MATSTRCGLLLLCILICGLPGATSIAQEINWYPDLNSATKAAAKQNKLVLLHFNADWCRPCKTLESFVFTNPAVRRAFDNNVIAVKIDVDKHPDLVQQYAVSKVPFDVALTATGRVVSKRQSPMDSSGYTKMISGYGQIINGLANSQNPGLQQNLDELKELISNEHRSFEGQPTSFTPSGPSHQAPRPSVESAELNRKSKFVSNPYAQNATPAPKQIANAFDTTGTAKDANSNDFKVVPNFVPNPVPSVDRNPFVAIAKSQRVPNPNQPSTNPTKLPTTNPELNQAVMPNQFALQNKKVDNSFATTLEGQLAVVENNPKMNLPQQGNQFAPSNTPIAGSAIAGPNATAQKVAEANATGSKVGGPPSSTQSKTQDNSFQPAAQVALRQPPTKKFQPRADEHPIKSQNLAKISLPKQDQQPPEVQAQIVLGPPATRMPTEARIAQGLTNPTTSSNPIPNSTLDIEAQSPPLIPGVAIKSKVAATKAPTVSAKPATEPEFALHGKCPVTLLTESRWVDGDKRWGCVHRNRTYLFSSEDNLKRFQSRPDEFSPVLAGFDPVTFHETGKLVDGLEENGVFMGKANRQRVVLFSSAETRDKFQKDPRKYLGAVRQAMQATGSTNDLLR